MQSGDAGAVKRKREKYFVVLGLIEEWDNLSSDEFDVLRDCVCDIGTPLFNNWIQGLNHDGF